VNGVEIEFQEIEREPPPGEHGSQKRTTKERRPSPWFVFLLGLFLTKPSRFSRARGPIIIFTAPRHAMPIPGINTKSGSGYLTFRTRSKTGLVSSRNKPEKTNKDWPTLFVVRFCAPCSPGGGSRIRFPEFDLDAIHGRPTDILTRPLTHSEIEQMTEIVSVLREAVGPDIEIAWIATGVI